MAKTKTTKLANEEQEVFNQAYRVYSIQCKYCGESLRLAVRNTVAMQIPRLGWFDRWQMAENKTVDFETFVAYEKRLD